MKIIRTLLGDIEPSELGFTNGHEHIVCVPPYWQERNSTDYLLDNKEKSYLDVLDFRQAGGDSIIDATAVDYGRRVDEVAEISQKSKVHIIGTAGFNKSFLWDAKIPDSLKKVYSIKEETFNEWIDNSAVDELTRIVVREIEEGLEGTKYKAGQLKFGTGYNSISPQELKVIEAVCKAQLITGFPLHTHTEAGTMALEQLELIKKYGVDPSVCSIGHMDRNIDYYYYKQIAETGAYLSFDGLGKTKYGPESARIDAIIYLIKEGYLNQILLGGDTARRSYYKHYNYGLGLGWIPEKWLPRFKEQLKDNGLDEDVVIRKLFVENPARYLSVEIEK